MTRRQFFALLLSAVFGAQFPRSSRTGMGDYPGSQFVVPQEYQRRALENFDRNWAALQQMCSKPSMGILA